MANNLRAWPFMNWLNGHNYALNDAKVVATRNCRHPCTSVNYILVTVSVYNTQPKITVQKYFFQSTCTLRHLGYCISIMLYYSICTWFIRGLGHVM